MPDITETIGADDNDGYQYSGGGTWFDEFGTSGDTLLQSTPNNAPGFRYLTIAVGKDDTIDDDTRIVFDKRNSSGSGPTGDLTADDIDDATVAFSNNDGPHDFTHTTANTPYSWGDPDNDATFTVDAKAIVQELVDRGGWASGNDMRFGVAQDLLGGEYCKLGDYSAGSRAPAILEINFTAAASGSGAVSMAGEGGLAGMGGLAGPHGGMVG